MSRNNFKNYREFSPGFKDTIPDLVWSPASTNNSNDIDIKTPPLNNSNDDILFNDLSNFNLNISQPIDINSNQSSHYNNRRNDIHQLYYQTRSLPSSLPLTGQLFLDSSLEYSRSLSIYKDDDTHYSHSHSPNINPMLLTSPPSEGIEGLGLIDDKGQIIKSENDFNDSDDSDQGNANDDDDNDDDYYEPWDDDDDMIKIDEDFEFNGNSNNNNNNSNNNIGKYQKRLSRRKSVTPEIEPEVNKRSRGRRVPTNDENRNFKCPDPRCAKVFVRNEHLKRHIKSLHRQVKPYECLDPKCNKKFTRLDNVSLPITKFQSFILSDNI